MLMRLGWEKGLIHETFSVGECQDIVGYETRGLMLQMSSRGMQAHARAEEWWWQMYCDAFSGGRGGEDQGMEQRVAVVRGRQDYDQHLIVGKADTPAMGGVKDNIGSCGRAVGLQREHEGFSLAWARCRVGFSHVRDVLNIGQCWIKGRRCRCDAERPEPSRGAVH